jgi:hypothetical protein
VWGKGKGKDFPEAVPLEDEELQMQAPPGVFTNQRGNLKVRHVFFFSLSLTLDALALALPLSRSLALSLALALALSLAHTRSLSLPIPLPPPRPPPCPLSASLQGITQARSVWVPPACGVWISVS